MNGMNDEKTEQAFEHREEKTPEKITNSNAVSPKIKLKENEFKTPKKVNNGCEILMKIVNEDLNKSKESFTGESLETFESDCALQNEGEEGMISTIEQARLLLAVSRTPSKTTEKTPSKEGTPSRKSAIENSPNTPRKLKRVELITLSSPKAKKIKQI